MIRILVASCALLVAASVAPAQSRELVGDWTAWVSEKHPERIQFSLRLGPSENSGDQFDRSEFYGLTSAQTGSPTRVPVQFELRREAGTIAFEGTFRSGHGAGEFTFVANREFASSLHSLGVEFAPKRGNDEQELFTLAIFDVSTDFIRSMQKIGYNVPLELYEQFRIFSVDPDYVHEMATMGFGRLTAEKLVETRIHGATPEYIREMRAAGNDLSLDEYIQSRIFQISPEFAAEMEHAGYSNLSHDMLVQFRIHGVTTEFVQQLRDLGYSRVPAGKLVEMRIHGVTPEFIRRVAAAGYRKVPIDKLVQMRIFDIDPEMVRALDDSGKPD
jgi:hypothetical protein